MTADMSESVGGGATAVKPIADTDSCEVSHLGYLASGRMKVFMDDGSEVEAGPGDVVAIHPGNDGDDDCVFLDLGEFGDYAKRSQEDYADRPAASRASAWSV